jgi:hypothetical protein
VSIRHNGAPRKRRRYARCITPQEKKREQSGATGAELCDRAPVREHALRILIALTLLVGAAALCLPLSAAVCRTVPQSCSSCPQTKSRRGSKTRSRLRSSLLPHLVRFVPLVPSFPFLSLCFCFLSVLQRATVFFSKRSTAAIHTRSLGRASEAHIQSRAHQLSLTATALHLTQLVAVHWLCVGRGRRPSLWPVERSKRQRNPD